MNKKLLILIPSYNVEKFIKKVLYSIPKKLLKTNKVELLIVNDASTDNTLKILKKIKKYSFKVKIITNKTNRGYGGVQKIGFNYAIKNKFNIVALLHGDGQYTPQLLPKLIGPINKNSSAILYVHTSNYKVVGFTNEIDIKKLSKLAQKNNIPLIIDLGSGSVFDFKLFGLPME